MLWFSGVFVIVLEWVLLVSGDVLLVLKSGIFLVVQCCYYFFNSGFLSGFSSGWWPS